MKITKRALTFFLSAMLTMSAWAVPAYRGWQERTLTDGTPITIRQIGDEFYHFWETQDGKLALEQEDGTFVLSDEQAPSNKQVIARRKAAAQLKGAARVRKNYGAIQPTKLLVLLVNFSDKSMKSAHNKAFFENLLNGSFPSVQDYFKQSSGNTYIPEFDVFGPYTLSNNMAYYGANDSQGNDEHPDQMVVDACALAYADGCNFSNYDTNGDGKVDNIYVIYAGYGEAAGAPANTIWPHSWEIYSQYVTGTLTYNGKTLGHYACSAELSGKSGSNSDGVGTFAHEFSHVIGLPDYYDTDYGTNSDNYVTPGEWTLMDQGSYNGNGQYPPLYSAYDKYFMGWMTPKFLAKDEVKSVTLTTTWNDNYQITGGAARVACTNTNTVYYIENRQKSGYDQYLPGHGMVVWKVTYNSNRWNNNDLNNTAGTLRYTIVPADGKTKNYGQASDPFPGTSNKKTWTPFTGCALTEITESSGNINFSYNGGVPKTTWDYVLYGENCTYPADGEVDKGSKLELTITPSSGYTLADPACWDVQMGGIKLTYGTDFTYNAGTNKFTINSVTGDVEIIVEGGRTVNWYVQGALYKTNVSVGGTITLPDAPANCSASRPFVGWCTNSTYKSPDTPPAYAKTGDAYSVANYYAVYADVSGGGSADASYTFTSKSWAASPSDWTSGKDGTAYLNSGVQVTTGTTGANATCPTSYSNISSIVVSYCTNSSKGAGSIKLSVDGTEVSESVTSEGGTTPRDLEFDFSETKPSGAPVITVNCGTNSIYVCGLIINYGGASYSGFSTDCSAPDPCALTSLSLNTTNVQTAFTTGETFSSEGLVVTANYSNCSSKIVTPTSVSTPDMSSDGNKTVTVSYTENAVTKTATYPITVSAPTTYAIRFFDGTTKLKEESLTLGATATPPTVDDCEEYDFVGWWTDPLSTTNTTSHTWVETFTVSGAQDYYAVYSHSEGGSSSTPSTETYGFEDADDATNWTITGPVKDSGKAASGTYAGKINTNHTYIEYKNKVKVTNFSFKLARTSTNSNYNVYVETSSDGSTWTAAETYAMNSFANGSFTSKSKDFDGKTELYVRFHCYNTTAVRYVDDISITYGGGSSSTTYYTTTKDCTIPTEVTVKFEANGGEGTMTDQTIDYNTATALKANTFERTGYTFLGWATSSTGEKVYDDEEEVTLTQKETTLYAVWEKNSWKVYFTTPSGATSVTANGETTSPLTIEYGETVTIVITPDAEHTISTVTATGGAVLSGEGGTRTFSMPDADVVLSITMVEKSIYTINFINMGETISSQQVMDGQAAVKPSDPEACEGYSFYGWWTAELGTDNTTAQKVDAYTATGNQDYYAVYSHTESGSGSSAASKTFDFATLATAGSWTDGSYHTTIAETPVTLTANGGGNNGRYYVSDKSWRLYNGGSVTISVADGEVTSVSSSPSKTFTISNGEASLSLSATTKFTSITVNYTVGSSSNTYYTTVPNCTPCEDKVNLTKGTDSNGTFTLDKVNGDYNNCTSDFIVTVSDIEAAEGYRFVNVTATGGNNEVTGPDGNGNYTVTYTKGNNITSIVTANFELIPSHTVTWSINGDDSNTASYQEGKAIVFPQTASGCAGKEFMGWSASTVAETDIAPTYVTSALMGDHDVTYYAVFATASSGSSGAWDGSTGGTYKIYAQVDDTKYYAAGTGAKITGTTNAAEATDYTFTKVSGGWTIQAGETYITYSSSTNLGTSGSAYTWELSSGVKGTHRLTSETAGRAWIFRAGTTNKFGGYATSNVTASGTEYFDLEIGSGSTTTYSGYTTSCTECLTKVTLTKGDETNGTFTLNKDDGEYNNCTADFVVTVSNISPADGYYCTGVTATGENVEVSGPDGSGNYTVTYTKGNNITSTITANFAPNPKYTVTWSMDGDESNTAEYEEGESIEFPTEASGCDGKKFMGWSAVEVAEQDEAPEYTESATMPAHDVTYYAVFAEEVEGGSGEIAKTTSIAVGDIVYLVYEEDSYELSGISTTSTKYGIGTHYPTTPAGSYPLEVVEGNDAGRVAFKHGSSYLNLGGNSNSLSTASSVTANSSWTVSFSSGNAVITNVAVTGRTIRWNSTYGQERFACYTTGQQAVQLYKQGAGASYSGYTTSCCSEVVAPKGIVVTAKSASATISWINQTGAVNGYSVVVKQGTDVVFEKNDIAAGVTSCSVTGLFAMTEYHYTVVAKGATCTSSASGNFTTSDCEDVPHNIVATPTVSQARISWTTEAAEADIRVYLDKACETELTESAKTGVSSPATIEGLSENTTYYFKIWANGTCVSAVDSLTTLTTSVEIAEWFADSIHIVLTADDSVKVIIEDKQEKINVEENIADNLFFSKYFEADGNNKMIAIYNGTKDSIDITNTWLKHSNKGLAETKICLKKFGKTPGVIAPSEEIIIMRFTSNSDGAIKCAEKEENYSEWNIIDDSNKDDGEGNNIYNWLNFSGPQSIGLYDGEEGKFIDVIGATTNAEGTGSLVQIKASASVHCSYTEQSTNDGSGFYADGKEVETDNDILLSTNRCLLIRKNTVHSGDTAVKYNVYTTQEACDDNIGKSFTTLGSEWVGYVIGKGDDAAQKTCDGLAEVGGFDYQGYYAQFDSIAADTLGGKPNEDGTYTVEIPRLDTLACSTLRISVYDRTGTEQKFTYNYKVPIMVQSGTVMTQDELFTKHDIATCKECDVVVMNNATLEKKTGDYNEIGHLILYPGSTFNMPEGAGDYTVQSLQFRVEGENAPVTKLNGNLMAKDGLITVTRRINNDESYFFSLPYDCNLADVHWSTGEPMVLDQGVRIKEYDSEARANEGSGNGKPSHWKMVTGDKLYAGKGYQISVNSKYYRELVFPMVVGSGETNLTTEENNKVTNTVSIHKYEPTDPNATTKNNWNWNFIAQPYISTMTPNEGDAIKAGWLKYTEPENPGDEGVWTYEDGGNEYLTLWNPATSTYDQTIYNKSGLKLDPFVAFFVQGKAEGEFTFEKGNRILSAPARHLAAKAENEDLSIFAGVTLSGNGQSDETALRIRPDFTSDYDLGYDLEKFLVFYTERPQIYMKTTDSRLAFQAIDDNTATRTFLPVGVYCYEAGTYTFGLSTNYPIDEIEAVYLHDNATGITTNLLYDTYSITTTKQLYTNVRFSLNVIVRRNNTEVPTDLNAANTPEDVTRKVIINDHVYIQHGGVIYDLTGKQLLNK